MNRTVAIATQRVEFCANAVRRFFRPLWEMRKFGINKSTKVNADAGNRELKQRRRRRKRKRLLKR